MNPEQKKGFATRMWNYLVKKVYGSKAKDSATNLNEKGQEEYAN